MPAWGAVTSLSAVTERVALHRSAPGHVFPEGGTTVHRVVFRVSLLLMIVMH